jgi:hypothetical protein
MKANWSKDNLIKIISESSSQREVLLKVNVRSAGGNYKTLKKYIDMYSLSINHFDKSYSKMVDLKVKKPLSEILVENSTFSRTHLKERLYELKILKRECCLCGQDENWNGMRISLILDHENGIYNDNRIENLRIVCPNCNAGLDTFAGRNLRKAKEIFYCKCGVEIGKKSGKCVRCASQTRRLIERPEKEILIREVEEFGYSATGRKYGVSDNCIRKWINK